jgi:pimeloyl-ACP methyl ester carboxylesterase
MKLRRKRFELMVFEPQRHRLLVGEDIGPEDSPHLFLCLPGLLETRASFEELITHLGQQARIMTIDWCGRGESDRLASAHDYRMSVYLSDLSLFYSHAMGAISTDQRLIASSLGKIWPARPTRIHLVGTSMGGLLAMFLASHQPKHLGGVVLNDVGPLLPWSGVFSLMTGIASAKTSDAFDPSQNLAERLNVDPHLLRAVRQPGHLNLPHETRLSGVDFSDVFSKVAAPLLLLRGMKSEIINDSVVKKIKTLHPQTQVLDCAECAHPVRYSKEVCDAIREFADRI